jgi:hypothetical protein
MHEFTKRDEAQAAVALVAWFRSQDLSHQESVQVMVSVIGFSLASRTNDALVLKRWLAETKTALGVSTQEWSQRLRDTPIGEPR